MSGAPRADGESGESGLRRHGNGAGGAMGRQPYEGRPLPDGRELIAIAEADELFKMRRRNGIAALNYTYVTDEPEQFAWPRSEMGGLMVDEGSGEILARPLQKFRTAAERGAERTDWSERHIVLPKLDGSLVFPVRDGWATKGGPTDTSAKEARAGAPRPPAPSTPCSSAPAPTPTARRARPASSTSARTTGS